MSLRRRLILGIAAVALVLVASGFVIADRVHTFLIDRVDEQLQAVPARIGGSGVFPGGSNTPGDTDQNALSEVVLAQLDSDGNVVYAIAPSLGERDDPLPDFSQLASQLHLVTADDQLITTIGSKDGSVSYRVLVSERHDGTYTAVAISLERSEDIFNDIVIVELIAGAAVLGVLGVMSFWLLRQGIRPLRRIADAADTITAGDLSHRVDVTNPKTEVGRVGIAINRMLGQIQQDFDEMEASEQRLKRFVSDASHELRTPLTSIRGYSELYQQGGLRAEGALDDAMRRVAQETDRMGRLVDELLMLARLDEHRPPVRSRLDLAVVAADAARDAQVVEPDRDIEVDAPESVVAEADEDLVRQVVANLLANVRNHTPVTAAVVVGVRRSGDRGVISVQDDGPGMDAETAAHAFERFTRADKARTRGTRGGSSGLGLSIARSAIEAHGGEVSLESVPGVGTTVTVSIPLIAPAPDPATGPST